MNFQFNSITRELKFISKRTIFLILALFLLIQLSTINISAQTGKIAYSYANAIYKMDADGANVQQLTFPSLHQRDFSPVWSPDGSKIAFVRVSSEVSGGNSGECGFSELCGETINMIPTYSINTIDKYGGNFTEIKSGSSFVNDLSWSPDGTKLAYVQGADTTFAGRLQTCSGNSYIYTVNAVAGGAARLIEAATDGIDPSWSPDGTKIFYAVNRDSEQYGIYSFDLLDDTVNRLTFDVVPPADPEISPDGTKIAYAVNYAEDNCIAGNMSTMGPTRIYYYTGSLIVYNIPQNTSLIFATGASSPVWHPSGNLILFISTQSPDSESGMTPELATMTATGLNQTQIPNGQSGELSGSWSP